jgi:type II secretory pathway pseudopilin PulG
MKNSPQQYKGDITLFVTIIISAIMLILLLALSQKITVESRISRENLYSQQALQVANTGIDAWQYQWVQNNTIDTAIPLNSTWPNSNTTGETIITDADGNDWIELSLIGGSSLQYRVEFQPGNISAGISPRIISKAKVVRANTIIERTLEQNFQTL